MGVLRTILVVDDEPELCRVLKKTLSREGYRVLTATSGLVALKVIKKEKVNLLLVDLKMPGMDGLEFLKRVKKGRPKIPAIILTAYGSLSSAREAMGLGVCDYLTKPFDLKEVITMVKEALG